jgi:DNA-binding transcriptional ArsR family regulator
VLAHPVRGRVLTALAERPDVTIRRVAERLGEPPRRVRHQVEALVEAGLAEITGEAKRRGVVERRYGAHPELSVDDEAFDPLSVEVRSRAAIQVIKILLADISVAANAGTLGRGRDRWEVRFYGEVDDLCLRELAEIYHRTFEEIGRTIKEGRKRVWESGEGGTEIVSALFFFEVPLWGRSSPDASTDASAPVD